MKNIAVDVLERYTRGGSWTVDLETSELWWSNGIYVLYGLSPEAYTPTLESSIAFYEPESAELIRQAIRQALDCGEGWSTTAVLRRADGMRRHVHTIGRVYPRAGRAPVLAGALVDVHEQTLDRRARQAMGRTRKDQGERWRVAAESAGLSLFEIDFVDHSNHVSGMLARILAPDGSADFTISRDEWLALIHPDDRTFRMQRLDAHRAGAFAYHVCEYRLCPPGGGEIHVSETGRIINDDHGDRLVGTLSDISDRVRGEQALKQSSERLALTLDHAPIGVALISPDGRWVSVNRALCRMLGYSEEELLQTRFQTVSHPEDARKGYESARALIAGEVDAYRLEKRYLHKAGQVIDVQIDASLLRDAQGVALYFITHIQDISERKRYERALFEAKQLADVTFEAIGEGVIRVDADGRISQINSSACLLLQTSSAEAVSRAFHDIVVLYESDRDQRIPDPIATVLHTGERIRAPLFTRVRRNRDGRHVPIVDSASPVFDAQGQVQGAVFVFRDISDVRRMTRELEHLARHDALTGLLNRRGFEKALSEVRPDAGAAPLPVYVLYLDLDHFKAINDLSGHSVGDEMLRQVAGVLRDALSDADIMGRVGGDEFAAVVHVADDASAEMLAERLIARIRRLHYSLDGRRHHASASIGIAPAGPDAAEWDTVFMRADAALYAAKDAGRNRFHLYGAITVRDGKGADYLNTTRMLQAGFDQGFFAIHLQAIVDSKAQLLGYEALLRYDDGHDVFAPDRFLPTAKRLGMMTRIDRWVISSTLQLIGIARAQGRWFSGCYVSINLSPLSLADPHFHDELKALLDASPDDAAQIAFEIIESDALFGQHYTGTIDDLRARGIRVWLDDFASGYNSFDTLKRVGVDGIKIDRSFVQDIEKDPIDRTVLRSIGDISSALSIDVVAEGVENARMFDLLIRAGFSQFQGYHFHRPDKASAALALTLCRERILRADDDV